MNLGIAYRAIPWIGARSTRALAVLGIVWVALTIIFELAFGRIVARASWERLCSDDDLRHGGLLPLGLAALGASPLLAARLRRARGEE